MRRKFRSEIWQIWWQTLSIHGEPPSPTETRELEVRQSSQHPHASQAACSCGPGCDSCVPGFPGGWREVASFLRPPGLRSSGAEAVHVPPELFVGLAPPDVTWFHTGQRQSSRSWSLAYSWCISNLGPTVMIVVEVAAIVWAGSTVWCWSKPHSLSTS